MRLKLLRNVLSKHGIIWCLIEFFPFRAVREKKESRRESHLKWAEKLTPRPSGKGQNAKDAVEAEAQESMGNEGMLPNDIVKVLAAREKYDASLLSV